MAKTKTQPPKLITRQVGKVNTHMECLIEHQDGRREYVSGKEFEELTKRKENGLQGTGRKGSN